MPFPRPIRSPRSSSKLMLRASSSQDSGALRKPSQPGCPRSSPNSSNITKPSWEYPPSRHQPPHPGAIPHSASTCANPACVSDYGCGWQPTRSIPAHSTTISGYIEIASSRHLSKLTFIKATSPHYSPGLARRLIDPLDRPARQLTTPCSGVTLILCHSKRLP